MDQKKCLIYSIIKFFEREKENGNLNEDQLETLEVTIQCIEQAYGIKGSDSYPNAINLHDLVKEIPIEEPVEAEPQVADKEEAEKHKNTGNDFMRMDKFQEAIDSYTKAISFDSTNPVYYSNRAAAYSKANLHDNAIGDCDKALAIDSNYSKAYGRKGLALSSQNRFNEAVENYRKALELDPENESYKQNLAIAENKAKEMESGGGGQGAFGGLGGMNFGNFLNNPAMMNMAAQFMQNSEVQNLMQGMMQGQGSDQNMSFERLLSVGQQMARQIQETNPELVSELRDRMQGGNPPEDNPEAEGN